MQDRVFWYTQAKVIGGGSTINAQIYIRGNALDYDVWAQAGCTGWSYREVLPYFKRAEGNSALSRRVSRHAMARWASAIRWRTLPICEAFFAARPRGRHSVQSRFQRRAAGRCRLSIR